MRIPGLPVFCAALPLLLAVPAAADDVIDQVSEGLNAYANKDYSAAITALEAATALLRQARSEMWKAYLPPAPPGWTAEETESGAGTLGMGSSASRRYIRGGEHVEISLMTDSPIMQGLAALIANPMIASAAGKTVVLGGRRVNYIHSDNSYMTMVADRVLVSGTGWRRRDRGYPASVLRVDPARRYREGRALGATVAGRHLPAIRPRRY